MKLYIEINTDACSPENALELNTIIVENMDAVLTSVSERLGISYRKKYVVNETLTLTINVA